MHGEESNVVYDRGICPVAEKLHSESFIGLNLCAHEFDYDQVVKVIESFRKVWRFLGLIS